MSALDINKSRGQGIPVIKEENKNISRSITPDHNMLSHERLCDNTDSKNSQVNNNKKEN